MGIDEYLIALRRHWRVVVAAVVLAAAVAWLTTTVAPPPPTSVSYDATTVLLDSGALGSVPGTFPGTASPSLETAATLATLEPVVRRVADAVGYRGDLQSLAGRARVVPDPTSPGILRITVSSGDAQEATRLADTWATELIDYLAEDGKRTADDNLAYVRELLARTSNRIVAIDRRLTTASDEERNLLEAQRAALASQVSSLSSLYQQYLSDSLQPPEFKVVEEATPVAVAAKGLQPPRSRAARVLIGAVLGLLGGISIALVLQRFDKRVRTAEAAGRAFRAPVLAEIPLIPKNEREGILVSGHPHSAASEAIRLLGAGILQGPDQPGVNHRSDGRRDDRRSRVVLVTSAAPGEGKTTLVANLAVVLGEMGKSVLVLSCDFRRPAIHELLGVPNLHGLADVLKQPASTQILDGCVQKTRFDGVSVAPSGRSFERPGEILRSDGMPRALREARTRADVILVDTAPILAASDAAQLIPGSDEVLVVARAGVVTASLARRTREVLDRLQSPQIGVVLNAAEETALPPGYHEYFRRTPALPDENESRSASGSEKNGMGDNPRYPVSQRAGKV